MRIEPMRRPKNHARIKSLSFQLDIFLKYASDDACPVFSDLKTFIDYTFLQS